jgi:hypothetical protein
MSRKPVAIAMTLSDREALSADEEISLRHLVRHLGHYDKFAVAPPTLATIPEGFAPKRFDRRFFGSAAAHCRLMLSEEFYSAFAEYDYILLYHLDALALGDRLTEWCASGYDYVGPPWLTCDDSPWVDRPRVGNGGFSLRRVDAFLRVLRGGRGSASFMGYWERRARRRPRLARFGVPVAKTMSYLTSARSHARRWPECNARGNEDYFWSDEACRLDPAFRVAPFEAGLQFAFEVAPRLCFELNGRQLPFGCHAWPRYDREFWEPYLLS